MTDIKARTIKEHICKTIIHFDSVGVEKIKIPNDKERWFLRFGTDLNEIKFCPYCGSDLEGTEKPKHTGSVAV